MPEGQNVIIANTHHQFVQKKIPRSDGTPGKLIVISQNGSPDKVSKSVSDEFIIHKNQELLFNSKYKNEESVFIDLNRIPIYYRLCGKKLWLRF